MGEDEALDQLLLSPEDEERKRLFLEGASSADLPSVPSPLAGLTDDEGSSDATVSAARNYLKTIAGESDAVKADLDTDTAALKEARNASPISADQAWSSAILSALPLLAGLAAGGKSGAGVGGQLGMQAGIGYVAGLEKDKKERVLSALDELKATRAEYKTASGEKAKANLEVAREESRASTNKEKMALQKEIAGNAIEARKDANSAKEELKMEKLKIPDTYFQIDPKTGKEMIPTDKQAQAVSLRKPAIMTGIDALDKMKEGYEKGNLEDASAQFARFVMASKDLKGMGANFTELERALVTAGFTKDAAASLLAGNSLESLGKYMTAKEVGIATNTAIQNITKRATDFKYDAKEFLRTNKYGMAILDEDPDTKGKELEKNAKRKELEDLRAEIAALRGE